MPLPLPNPFNRIFPVNIEGIPKSYMKLCLSLILMVYSTFTYGSTLADLTRGAYFDEVKRLINTGSVTIDEVDERGATALHYAALYDKTGLMKTLIAHGADINTQDTEGNTPLIEAVRYSNYSAASLLLNIGADIEQPGADGDTPFMHACTTGAMVIVNLLLRYKATVPQNALYIAAANGHGELTDTLLNRGLAINYQDTSGYTALMKACERGYTDVVRLLLKSAAAVNLQDNRGNTALHHAINAGDADTITILLDHNADITLSNHNGDTPLIHAFFNGNNRAVVTGILNFTGHVLHDSQRIIKGEVPEVIARYRMKAINEVLDNHHRTPLMYAARGRYMSLVRLFCSREYINRPDHGGKTALIYGIESGSLPVLRYLIARGADVTVTDKEGNTPLMYACKTGNLRAARLLLSKGSDINRHNNAGDSPVSLAARSGNTPLINMILKQLGAGLTGDRVNTDRYIYKMHDNSEISLSFDDLFASMKKMLNMAGYDAQTNTFDPYSYFNITKTKNLDYWQQISGLFPGEVFHDNYYRVNPLITYFSKKAMRNNWSRETLLMEIIKFIQDIPFKRPYVSRYTIASTFFDFLTPHEMLFYNVGDCDSKCVLLLIILDRFKYDAVFLESRAYLHTMVGINISNLNLDRSGYFFTYDNHHYYFLETTVKDFAVGDIDIKWTNMKKWRVIEMNRSIQSDALLNAYP